MRVLYLTAGTGGFFCGACIRDNALVHAMRRMDHEVHLMPLYLPTIVEQEDASDCPLFLGGINIWLQDKVSLFRHTPRFIDKLFDNSRLLKMAGQRSGFTDAKVLGHMTVSTLKGLGKHFFNLQFGPTSASHHLTPTMIKLAVIAVAIAVVAGPGFNILIVAIMA